MTLAAIRVRGTVNVNTKIRDTMDMLHLQHPNHCSILPVDPSTQGMLNKVKDYVTYGEVNAGMLATLLKTRGHLEGDRLVTDEDVAERTEFADVQAFAEAVVRGDARLKDLPGLKAWFRLQPPKGGYEATKHHYSVGGSLGYRGREINALLERMM